MPPNNMPPLVTHLTSKDGCIYDKHWSHNFPSHHDDHENVWKPHANDDHWVRAFMFGDSHADTHRFGESTLRRAPKEIGCAAAASALVSPLVSILDRCLVQEITGTKQFASAFADATRSMFSQPRQFFGGLGFRLTFAVYFGTYAVANLSELGLDVRKIEDDESRKNGKVAATAVANVGLLAWRDSVFARVYSGKSSLASGPQRATPLRTLGLFAARDMGTMYATFYLAPRAAEYMQHHHGWNQNAAELSAALVIPAAMQVATAPMHIHAMDYYVRPDVSSIGDRLGVVKKEFSTVSFTRGFRILPAFGLGSFSNNKFREMFIQHTNPDDDYVMPNLAKHITKLIQPGASEHSSVQAPMLATSSGTKSK